MYHIKPDKRSQASAAEIIRGLQECLKTMPLKTVTVSDIHRVTGISRATFYRLFDTPDDVLHYLFDQMSAEITDTSAYSTLSAAERLEKTIAEGMEYHEFIKALAESRRFDLLYEYTEKNFRQMDAAYALFPADMDPIAREYVLTHLSMSMVATLITWAKNGRKESAAEVVGHLKQYIQILSGLFED